MSDYVKDLIRMSMGGNTSGRDGMNIPDEIMDAMAGDSAQEALMKEKLLNELRANKSTPDSRYISLDLFEMDANHVDDFLKHARKKIIKRSKPTRIGCCKKIGGALDAVLAQGGGEFSNKTKPSFDKDGQPHHVENSQNCELDAVAVSEFVKEEFSLYEHSNDCQLATTIYNSLSEQEKFIQSAIKKPGALRAYYGVKPGENIPLAKAKADCARLQKAAEGEKKLSKSDAKLFHRLQLFLKVLKPVSENLTTSAEEDQQADNTMNRTQNALSVFNEVAGYGSNAMKNAPYDYAKKTKHSSDVGDLNPDCYYDGVKDAQYNADYDTQPTKLKSGKVKIAGKQQRTKTRDVDAGDPIGETKDPSLSEGSAGEAALWRKFAGTDKAMRKTYPNFAAQVLAGKGEKALADTAGLRARDALAFKRLAIPSKKRSAKQDAKLDAAQEEGISATANAVHAFMEAFKHDKTAAPLPPDSDYCYDGKKKERPDNKDPLVHTGQMPMKGKRDKGDWATKGESKAKFEPGADPIGGATSKQLK